MKDYFKPKTWLITIFMFLVALGFSSTMVYYEFGLKENIKITRASASDNVSGWAWNANTGWISFNCASKVDTNGDGTGDQSLKICDGGVNQNKICNPGFSGAVSCPGANCVDACSLSNYGVSIALDTGIFSGYAWSSSVGWISFNRSDAGVPPAPPYDTSVSYIAEYDFSTPHQVTGWAKILSLGDNGWIKFNGNKQDGQPWTPGITIDPATGNFSGWAWNAYSNGSSDIGGIGWVSFNCSDVLKSCQGGSRAGAPCPVGNECLGGGSCVNTCTALSNYKVVGNINRPPTVTNMTVPNWSYTDAAGVLGALNARPSWTFNDQDTGSSESAYRLIVNTNNNVNDPNPIFDSGKCFGQNNPINKCKAGLVTGTTVFPPLGAADGLNNYDTRYYWWVKVWDNNGSESVDWAQYDTNPDTDNNDGSNNKTFTTYKHEMPEVDFTWFPLEPSKGEEVQFTDQSKVYSVQPDTNPVDCTDALCDWEWSSISPGVTFKDPVNGPSSPAPIIIFSQAGNPTITLKVTDFDGYIIYRSKTININAKLPGWKEVKPE